MVGCAKPRALTAQRGTSHDRHPRVAGRLGLGQHADVFEAEHVTIENLPEWTDADLKDLHGNRMWIS